MARAKWKGPYISRALMKNDMKKAGRVYSRASFIFPRFLGKNLRIYNGQKFQTLKIINQLIGNKIGEFVFCRKFYKYKKT